MRCIIAGPRDYLDYYVVSQYLDVIFSKKKPDVIISGGCSGVDSLGERWARQNAIPIEVYPYDRTMGKRGGPIRNELMATKASHCVVLWKGESKGSKNMLQTAHKHNLIVREVRL